MRLPKFCRWNSTAYVRARDTVSLSGASTNCRHCSKSSVWLSRSLSNSSLCPISLPLCCRRAKIVNISTIPSGRHILWTLRASNRKDLCIAKTQRYPVPLKVLCPPAYPPGYQTDFLTFLFFISLTIKTTIRTTMRITRTTTPTIIAAYLLGFLIRAITFFVSSTVFLPPSSP